MASVLVVDDMIDTCRLLVRIMSSLGHHMDMATSGTEAIRCLEKHVPHLIVLDVMMPEMAARRCSAACARTSVRPPFRSSCGAR